MSELYRYGAVLLLDEEQMSEELHAACAAGTESVPPNAERVKRCESIRPMKLSPGLIELRSNSRLNAGNVAEISHSG